MIGLCFLAHESLVLPPCILMSNFPLLFCRLVAGVSNYEEYSLIHEEDEGEEKKLTVS